MKWALDEDLELIRRSIEPFVEFTDLETCEVVHSIWWEALLNAPPKLFAGKRVICNFSNRPFHYMKHPNFSRAQNLVGHWIVRTKEAECELQSVRINCSTIPYIVNTDVFQLLPQNDPNLLELRQTWNIPQDCYLIGNFHRDTEGADLCSPKLQKGPDIFVEILKALSLRGHRIHALLAGPRRYWIRRNLKKLGIPFTFVGEALDHADDIGVNILPRTTLNLLYNLLDLCLITSRWEGGPHSAMEASASRCKVISTRVGLAEELLEPECVYSTAPQAVDMIEQDILTSSLNTTIVPQYQRILEYHQPNSVAPKFRALYEEVGSLPAYSYQPSDLRQTLQCKTRHFKRLMLKKIATRFSRSPFTVGVWHNFFPPPYGGGNQFMMALCKAMKQQGIQVLENQIHHGIDAYILNSVHFDLMRFQEEHKKSHLKIIHRIDGPIYLYRGSDQKLDQKCFELNQELAAATVLQSSWTYQRIVDMGYKLVNPVIIHNAVDPDIFHRQGRIPFDRTRKIRLISTSWSWNARKGGPIYKWIEEHLDWDRFEYTFVGNASEQFERIHHIQPVPSEKLADILRQHDIYITASQNDPCSNALIEALSCGLPALYLQSGGHPELVGHGGLSFQAHDEIFSQLDTLVENYEMFQHLITVPTLDNIAQKYVMLLQNITQSSFL